MTLWIGLCIAVLGREEINLGFGVVGENHSDVLNVPRKTKRRTFFPARYIPDVLIYLQVIALIIEMDL